jgi:hypothetical protein
MPSLEGAKMERNPRVSWTDAELMMVVKSRDQVALDPAFMGKSETLIMHEAQKRVLPIARQMQKQSVYTSLTAGRMAERIRSIRDTLSVLEQEKPVVVAEPVVEVHSEPETLVQDDTDVLANFIVAGIRLFQDELRTLVRDEIKQAIADREDTKRDDVMSLIESVVTKLKSPQVPIVHAVPSSEDRGERIDIIGLLPDQANMVKASDVGKQFRLKFISPDQALRENNFANTVVLVKKFISHSVQSRVISKGSKFILANGAADSVVTVLSGRITSK